MNATDIENDPAPGPTPTSLSSEANRCHLAKVETTSGGRQP